MDVHIHFYGLPPLGVHTRNLVVLAGAPESSTWPPLLPTRSAGRQLKRWLAPRPACTSFRRYSLRHELLAAAAGAALLIGAGMVSLAVLRGRLLDLQRADANRVS